MNYMRQRTRNDCAYTCLVMLLREDYTALKNRVPALRDFRRSNNMPANRQAITLKNRHRKINRDHPFAHLMGLDQRQIKLTLLQNLKDYENISACRMGDLDKNATYLISVPSINFHNTYHCIIMREGRVWDPSNLRRYVYKPNTKIISALKIKPLHTGDLDEEQATKFIVEEISKYFNIQGLIKDYVQVGK